MTRRRPHPARDDGLPPQAVFGDHYKDRLKAQIAIIQERLGNVGIGFDETLIDPNLDNADPLYLYNDGVILVRDEDIPRVIEIVGGGPDDSLIPGVTRWHPEGGTIAALQLLDRALGAGAATPDHIMYITPAGAARRRNLKRCRHMRPHTQRSGPTGNPMDLGSWSVSSTPDGCPLRPFIRIHPG